MTNIQATLGLQQLKILNICKKKGGKSKFIFKKINNKKVFLLNNFSNNKVSSYHLTSLITKKSRDRNKLLLYLKKNKVVCSVHYKPINKMSYFKKYCQNQINLILKNFYKKSLSLPNYPDLRKKDLSKICKLINDF